MANEHETIEVLITSIDAKVTHPFRATDTVDDVRKFGYEKLVQDKSQVPLNNTWIELSKTRLENATVLSTLLPPETEKKEKGRDKDMLTLTLAWTQQGGLR